MVRFLVLVCAVLLLATTSFASVAVAVAEGQQQAANTANPVRRVITLLQKMAEKVEAEGKTEQELYDKYMCYCKTSGGALAKSIAENTAKVPQVQSDIEAAEAELTQLVQDVKAHREDRAAAKAAVEDATKQREGEHRQFLSTSGDYKVNIGALEKAVAALEKGMSGGFLQAGAVSREQVQLLQRAVASDTAVPEFDRQTVAAFLAGHSTEGSGYAPASGEVVGILKTILDDFRKNLSEAEETEKNAVQLYQELVNAKTKQVDTLTQAIETKSVRDGDLRVDIINMKQQLTDAQAALVEDQKFQASLEQGCSTKTAEWEGRKKTRAEELVAISETIKLLNDDDALDLFKKTLPSPSLLQVQASQKQLRRQALAIIRKALGSSSVGRPGLDFILLALSGRSKSVDLTKINSMIDNMIALLKKEQQEDENKKEYCDLQVDRAEDKAKELEKRIDDLKTVAATKDEAISALETEIKELSEGVKALDKSVADATEQRKKEHEEYVELIRSNSAAKELLGHAKNRLNKYYNPDLYKPPPKKELSTEERIHTNMGGASALQAGFALVQVREHSRLRHLDAPPAEPETWQGGYEKKGQETTGVIAMIDLLIKDLDKEITQAEAEEKDAQREYEETTKNAAVKRAADTKSIAAKVSAKAGFELDRTSATGEIKVSTKELMATKEYESQLHQECDWLLQNFELRKEARAGEADSLKQAKAVLAGADFSLAQRQAAARK